MATPRTSMVLNSSYSSNNYKSTSWLLSTISELSLLNNWKYVQNKLAKYFIEFLEINNLQSVALQCYFELLGRNFIELYLPNYKYDESILLPPNFLLELLPSLKLKLCNELLIYINKVIDNINDNDINFQELIIFKNLCKDHINNRIYEEVNRRLNRTISNIDASTLQYNEVCGEAVAELITRLRHKTQFDNLKLVGLILPHSLRSYLYKSTLYHSELFKNYANIVSDRMIVDSISNPSNSPIRTLLLKIYENTNVEFFSNNKISPWKNYPNLLLAICNRFYVYCDEYGSRVMFHAGKIIEILGELKYENEDEPGREEHLNLLTIMLIALFKFISEKEKEFALSLKKLANNSWELLQQLDPVYCSFLMSLFSNFSMVGVTSGAGGLSYPIHPAMLMERWMEYSFVGFLNDNSLNFVWDTCFLLGFSKMSEFSVILLRLLKKEIMQCKTIKDVDYICVFGLKNVKTRDLVRVFRENLALKNNQ